MSKTLTEIEAINQNMLTPAMVAEYLGVSPQAIRVQAKNRPELLGFPVIVIGSRVKIPKNAFIKFFKGKKIWIRKDMIKINIEAISMMISTAALIICIINTVLISKQ